MPRNTPDITIRAALVNQGHSLTSWAISNGYKPSTVRKVVSRWEGRSDRVPHGAIARKILLQLKQDTGVAAIPSLEQAA